MHFIALKMIILTYIPFSNQMSLIKFKKVNVTLLEMQLIIFIIIVGDKGDLKHLSLTKYCSVTYINTSNDNVITVMKLNVVGLI